MSKVIPSKFMSQSVNQGVESFKEISCERIRLQPIGTSANTKYTPHGLNKIHFRLPCYSNSYLDNSRSFLTFHLKTTGTGHTSTSNTVFGNNLPIFARVVIKTSSGLTIEDITNADVLRKLLTITSSNEDYMVSEGHYGANEPANDVGNLLHNTGIEYCYYFNHGILSRHLESYIPLHMMDGNSGYAFDIELYLNEPGRCMRTVSTGIITDASYEMTKPIYNLCLLRMDESLCSKFNQIACDPSSEIRIPFTSYHTHVSTITSLQNVVHINENCTNLKRIYSVYLQTSHIVQNQAVLPFFGSIGNPNASKVSRYNYRIGSKWVYNESIDEVANNNLTLQFVKDSTWGQNKQMVICKQNAENLITNNFESAGSDTPADGGVARVPANGKHMFFHCANMTYSPEEYKGVIQGLSSSIPIELTCSFLATPSLMVNNICELGYYLVIKNGNVTFQEMKPGSQSVY
jgi:hypothetical protein